MEQTAVVCAELMGESVVIELSDGSAVLLDDGMLKEVLERCPRFEHIEDHDPEVIRVAEPCDETLFTGS